MKIITIILGILIMASSCNQKYLIECRNFDCIEKNKNQPASIHGVFQDYSPNTTVKDKSYKFWDYEILLSDSVSIPINAQGKNYDNYLGKKVIITGLIFYGIVMGEDDGKSSNATGFRIDMEKIQENK